MTTLWAFWYPWSKCSYSSSRALSKSSLSSLSEPPQSSPTPGTRRSTAAACTQATVAVSSDMQIAAITQLTPQGRNWVVKWLICSAFLTVLNCVLLYAPDGPCCLLHKKAWGHKDNQWQRLECCRNVSPGTSHVLSEGRIPTARQKSWS